MATILVVEDDARMRSTVGRCLRHAGHTVVEARSGPEGLQCHSAGAGAFDLVICDLMMPGGGGIETITVLHARDKDLPILAITGAAKTLEYLKRRKMPSIRDYLAKPFTTAALVETMERLLPKSAASGVTR